MKDKVYLNGEYIAHSNAVISADDRGFHFADGIYEVVKYYNGKPFRLEDHLERLRRSLREINLEYTKTEDIPAVFKKLLDDNQLNHEDAGVYIQISRGAHQRIHQFPPGIEPTVYAFAFPFASFKENLENGIRVITAEDIRWLRCDIKSVSLLPNSMLYSQAVKEGAGECVLIRNGWVTEATHSSVFGVRKGIVYTHPLSNLILPGITRKVLLEICKDTGIPFREQAIPESEIGELDELIIAGTGSEVMPAVRVNEKPLGSGKPGPVTRFLQEKFFESTGK
jgi:D-alanine transaminase